MYNIEKLRDVFPDTTVYKDQNVMATFRSAAVPSFLRDWILKRKADADGKIHDTEELGKYIADIIPRREQKLALQDSARQGETKKFLTRISIAFNVNKGHISFEMPELGFTHAETLIENYVWERIKDEVIATAGGWGLVKLGYCSPEDSFDKKGRITLLEFKNFCPYEVNLDAYREARKNFTITEWTDILLGAIDYNPDGYSDWTEKHTLLTRLLPFIEPRVNLVELAPKGTGKSYLFGSVGKYGWLASGGTLSRAKMFYDMSAKQAGLVASSDFVAMDEIQSINFGGDPQEMQGALKTYMESGEATVAKSRIIGKAGIILLGNIPRDEMDISQNMFRTLPQIFQESALLDRFHGFIEGKNIPRMKEELKIKNWALNSEYFTEIMHLLREQSECMCYRGVVEELVEYPQSIDTRDKEAVLRLCTAYLKLFFPHWTRAEFINSGEFKQYCLRPAFQMRRIIRYQLSILDAKEYAGKPFAEITLKQREE